MSDTEEQQPEPGYDKFLRRKVEKARASMREGQGRTNAEVQADFAALREDGTIQLLRQLSAEMHARFDDLDKRLAKLIAEQKDTLETLESRDGP